MTLYICRHGRTEANAGGLLLGRADPSLDELGRAQAEAIAGALPGVAAVISSPLARCRETAAAFGLPVTVDERLIELDYGDWDLKPLKDVAAEDWASWRSDNGFRPPGGETLEELHTRVSELLDQVLGGRYDPQADPRSADVALVTHVSPIKAAVAYALGVGIEISWRCFVGQASISEIGAGGDRPSLRSFNDLAHLDRLEHAVNGGNDTAVDTGKSAR